MVRSSASLDGSSGGDRLRRRAGIGAALAALLVVGGLGLGAVLRDDGRDDVAADTVVTEPVEPELVVETTLATTTTIAPSVCPPPDGSAPQVRAFTGPPPNCLSAGATYEAVVTTNEGTFTITLDAAAAPQSVNSFVYLARNRFYDGLTFHRMIRDFVVQTGSPNGADDGGPGYTTPDEVPADGAVPSFEVGTVAMGLGAPGTNGSQFFVVSGPLGAQFLGTSFTVFGRVTDGLDVITKLNDLAADADESGSALPPSRAVTVETIRITETLASTTDSAAPDSGAAAADDSVADDSGTVADSGAGTTTAG